MERDLVKRFISKDGMTRMSIYRDDDADNPRYMTDEPLHCEDWSRDHSIMVEEDKKYKSNSARHLLEYMLNNYGDYNKIIDTLVENGKHMTDGCSTCDDALMYNKSEHSWDLKSNACHYNYMTGKNEDGWFTDYQFYCKKYGIDMYTLFEDVHDSTIDFLVENCMTDKVKIMSYSFGYYGEIYFDRGFSTDSEGIAWLEKDEFLKYSGHKEDYWKDKSLDEIEWLLDYLEAWSENEVYGFVVEDCIKSRVHKEYLNSDKDDEDCEETEWEESDSYGGFYGELDDVIPSMFDCTNLRRSEMEEENV